jgi:quercetin dioxygenase-like cupin family protein
MLRKIDLKKIDSMEIIPGFKARVIQTDNITMAFWEIKAGSTLPEHDHPNEQITNLVKGTFELKVDGKISLLTPDSVVIIPPSIKHSGMAITDCEIVDIFYPRRDIG